MSVGKNKAPGSELVQVGRTGLMIALQHAGPVVEIIYGDKEDIELLVLWSGILCLNDGCRWAKQESIQNQNPEFFHHFHNSQKATKHFMRSSVETGCA